MGHGSDVIVRPEDAGLASNFLVQGSKGGVGTAGGVHHEACSHIGAPQLPLGSSGLAAKMGRTRDKLGGLNGTVAAFTIGTRGGGGSCGVCLTRPKLRNTNACMPRHGPLLYESTGILVLYATLQGVKSTMGGAVLLPVVG